MQNDSSRRVVITGVGVVTPLGNEPAKLIDSLRKQESGIRELTQVPLGVLPIDFGAEAVEFTGKIEDYGPLEKSLQRTIRKASKVMCREIEMGVAVAQKALVDAGYNASQFDADRTGILYGCDYIMSLPEEYAAGIAACLDEARNFDFSRWGSEGLPKVNPLWLLKYLPNMPASHIAIYNDLRGPNNSITVREASAGAAISEAFSTIQRGHADALIVGATGSRVHPLRTLHAAMQEPLAAERDDPAMMCRPFDASRDGGVVGEGAAAMICETLQHARARGANILAEIVGHGSSAVGPAAGQDHLRTAFRNVLRRAVDGVDPGLVGHIHAHGVGTIESDIQEAQAIVDVFGPPEKQPPVTTAKGHFGNLGAGGGMVEIVASLLAMDGPLFPIRNLENLDAGCQINAVMSGDEVPTGNCFVSLNITPQGQASAVRIGRFTG